MSLVYVEVNHVVCRLITHQVTRVVSANHLQHVPSTAGRLRRTGTSVPSRQLVSSLVIGGDCDSFTFLFVHTRACVFTPIDRSQAIRLSVLLNSLRSAQFSPIHTHIPQCPANLFSRLPRVRAHPRPMPASPEKNSPPQHSQPFPKILN